VTIGVRYAELIANEVIPACRLLIMAAKRFLAMYEQAKSGEGAYYWSDAHAVEPCAFIETLCHVKGVLAKTPIKLEAWQVWVIIAIYGFRWSDTGDRVVNIAQLEITRKQGKSLAAAGIALYELGPNAYVGDDLYIIAPTAALAQKVLEPMVKMVEHNPPLKEFYGIRTLNERIDVAETESYAVILSSSGKKQDGHDPKVVIADEFHSLPASIFNVMKSSQGARPESLFLEIGSAGYNAFGVGWDERNLAIEVLEGKRDRPELFAAIWAVDPEDFGNWRNERVIRKANPNFGVSTPKRKVLQEIEEIYTNPRNKNETLRTRFNVWGLGESRLISRDQWDACADETLKIETFADEECWIGVDLATRNDMVCWVAEFEMPGGGVVFFAQHYVPEQGPWREDEEVRDIYEAWHEQGWLTFTPGSFHTYEEIERDLFKLCDDHDVQLIAIDDREANALMGALTKRGKPVVAFRKNATNYSEPCKDIIGRAVGKTKGLAHNANPVLGWNVENVIGGYNTAELVLPKKISEHSNMKIDGYDGMCMSHACWLEQVDTSKVRKPNPMATRGLRIVGE
jgi:phage terminase large subunit-like protein